MLQGAGGSGDSREKRRGRIPAPIGAWRWLFHIPRSLSSPCWDPIMDTRAACVPQASRAPLPGCGAERAWLPTPTGSLSPQVSIRDVRDQGNVRGSLCPQRGRDQDRQTGLRASAAGTRPFPSTPQPGTWWSQPFCCRKAVFWLSGTQPSPCPLFPHTPLAPAALWHWGSGGRRRTAPQ